MAEFKDPIENALKKTPTQMTEKELLVGNAARLILAVAVVAGLINRFWPF